MKTKLLLLLVLSAFKLTTFAQNKVVKYCEVEITQGFSEKVRAVVNYGIVDSLFSIKEQNLKIQLQKVNSLRTRPDVLNYMTSIGWSLVNITSHLNDNDFYFKKEFDPSEFNSTKTQ